MFASNPNVFIPLRETYAFFDSGTASNKWEALLAEFRQSKKAFLVEKTPSHIHNIGLIRTIIANPRFALMVRDGRDVAASFIKRLGDAGIGARRWITENKIVLEQSKVPDVAVIRYEDLIVDPEGTLKNICSFSNIEYSSEMLQYHQNKRNWFGVTELKKGDGSDGLEHRLLRSWQINQPIFDERGKWKELLSESDLQLFENDDARELMRYFKYN